MAATLPSKIVLIVERVICKHLRSSLGSDIARVVTDVLAGEPYIGLREWKWNAYDLVAVDAKLPGWIARIAVVPMDTSKAEARLIENSRRESVDPACPSNLRRVA